MEIETTEMVKIGQSLTEGFFNVAFKYLLSWVVVMVILWLLSGVFWWSKDDLDASNWNRSGLKILTDHRTGLQYLSDGKGGLILRVDANGKPIR